MNHQLLRALRQTFSLRTNYAHCEASISLNSPLINFPVLFPRSAARVQSSSSCGPFQDLERPWQVVTDIVGQWNDQLVYYLSYITSPGFAVYVILILWWVAARRAESVREGGGGVFRVRGVNYPQWCDLASLCDFLHAGVIEMCNLIVSKSYGNQ